MRSFELFLVFRFLQAFFGCGVTVLARLIIQRVYPTEKHIGIITTLALAVAISPVIAPVLGGILIDSSTWQILFYVLALAGSISLVFIGLFIPSLPPKQQIKKDSVVTVLRDCSLAVKGTFFYVHLLSISLVSMAQIAFVSSSAAIMQSAMGISAKLYGVLLALIAIGFVIGTQITRIVVPRYGLYFIYRVSATIALISSILMLSLVSLYPSCYFSLAMPMFGLMLTVGLVVPASQAGLLQIKSNNAGYLASIFFFSQIMLSTVYGSLSKFIVISTTYELAVFTVIPSFIFCLFIVYSLRNLRLQLESVARCDIRQ